MNADSGVQLYIPVGAQAGALAETNGGFWVTSLSLSGLDLQALYFLGPHPSVPAQVTGCILATSLQKIQCQNCCWKIIFSSEPVKNFHLKSKTTMYL